MKIHHSVLILTILQVTSIYANSEMELSFKNFQSEDRKLRASATTTLARVNKPEDIKKVLSYFDSHLSCGIPGGAWKQGLDQSQNKFCHDPKFIYNMLAVLNSLASKEYRLTWDFLFKLDGVRSTNECIGPSFFDFIECKKNKVNKKNPGDLDNCRDASYGGYRPDPELKGPAIEELKSLYSSILKKTVPDQTWTESKIKAAGGESITIPSGYTIWTYTRNPNVPDHEWLEPKTKSSKGESNKLSGVYTLWTYSRIRWGLNREWCSENENFSWLFKKMSIQAVSSINEDIRFQQISKIDASGKGYFVGHYLVYQEPFDGDTTPVYAFEVRSIPELSIICRAYVEDFNEVSLPDTYQKAFEKFIRVEDGKCKLISSPGVKVKME